MEIGGAILTGVKGLFGLLIPPLKQRFFDQPKIYIVFKFNNSGKSPRGISSKNDTSVPMFPHQVIYENDLTWNYDITFRNNSEYPAYNLKLIEPTLDKNFILNPAIDKLKPILSNAEISHKAKFYQFYEGLGDAANIIAKNPPEIIKSGKFTLEYTNVKGEKFYTFYNDSEDDDKKHQFKGAKTKKILGISIATLFVVALLIYLFIKFNFSKPVEKPNIDLKKDAHDVAESIIITGYEKTGDYIGYLSQLAGFYSRHKDKYPTECEYYKKQLDNWTEYLKKQRDKGNIIQAYTSDLTELQGLVSSGERHLEQIEK